MPFTRQGVGVKVRGGLRMTCRLHPCQANQEIALLPPPFIQTFFSCVQYSNLVLVIYDFVTLDRVSLAVIPLIRDDPSRGRLVYDMQGLRFVHVLNFLRRQRHAYHQLFFFWQFGMALTYNCDLENETFYIWDCLSCSTNYAFTYATD
jgi:hypothetical protein